MRPIILFTILSAFFTADTLAQKKDDPPAATEQKVVSGAILLNDKTPPNATALLASLRKDWKLKTDSVNTTDKTTVFSSENATVMIAFLDYPVPPAEIRTAARLSWLWRSGAPEALRHQSQLVISVIGTTAKTPDLYKLFTKVAAGVLENTNASGFYVSSQYLLLSKDFYTSAARNMRDNKTTPIYCWVYFGMTQEKELSGGYTYGLQEFGLQELEIVNSKQPMQETHAVLYDAALTVIQYNLKLQNGQTFTTLEGQKLKATLSKAAFQEGEETIKLEYAE